MNDPNEITVTVNLAPYAPILFIGGMFLVAFLSRMFGRHALGNR